MKSGKLITIIASALWIGALLVVGCEANAPPAKNTTEATGVPTFTVIPGVEKDVLPDTPTPLATPGLVVYGVVRDQSGKGMENVEIYRRYASYEATLVATTDANGYYQSDFYFIPGDEMVAISASQGGMEFVPEYHSWRHYYGYEITRRDFTKR